MGATMNRLRKYWQAPLAMVVTFFVIMLLGAPAASATTDEADETAVVQTTETQKAADEEASQSDASDQSTADDPPDGGGDSSSSSDPAPEPEPEPKPAPQDESSDDSEGNDQGLTDGDEGNQSDSSEGNDASDASDQSENSDDTDQGQSDDNASQTTQESSPEAAPTTMEAVIEAAAATTISYSQSGTCPNFTVSAFLSGDIPDDMVLGLVVTYGTPLDGFPTTSVSYGPGLVAGQAYPISFSTATIPDGADPGYPWFVDPSSNNQLAVFTSYTVDTSSCDAVPPTDSDNDGVNDEDDQCPNEAGPASNNGCPVIVPPVDPDGDGVIGDADQCPNEAGPASNNGCPLPQPPADDDNDGVPNNTPDLCPNTPAGSPVDANGCLVVQPPVDSDGDGKTDDVDQCPGTQPGFTVDDNGCIVCPPGTHPIYAESDGIVNDCQPDAPVDVTVPKPTQPGVTDPPGPGNAAYEPQEDTDSVDWVLNPDGSYDANAKPGNVFDDGSKTVHFDVPTDSYDPNTYDQDGDGVVDALDKCADTPAGTSVGVNGCPIQVTPVDSDGDGLPDYLDRCPNVAGSTPSGCPPIVVAVPAQPEIYDPAGPDNAEWIEPADTKSVVWTLHDDGSLTASARVGFVFADGRYCIEFGLAPDSHVEPAPPAQTAGPTNAVPDYVGTGEGDTGSQSTMHFRVIAALLASLLAGIVVTAFRRRQLTQ